MRKYYVLIENFLTQEEESSSRAKKQESIDFMNKMTHYIAEDGVRYILEADVLRMLSIAVNEKSFVLKD